MSFAVEITPLAEADVREAVGYLVARSKQGAVAWRKALDACLQRLASSPLSIGLAPESELFAEDVRQAIFQTKSGRPYRVVFVVRDRTAHVLRVRCPGQDLLSAYEVWMPR